MANLTPSESYDSVPQLEMLTRVQGGAGGPSNTQAQALLNRTAFLKKQIDNIQLQITAIENFLDIIDCNCDGTTVAAGGDSGTFITGTLFAGFFEVVSDGSSYLIPRFIDLNQAQKTKITLDFANDSYMMVTTPFETLVNLSFKNDTYFLELV